MTVRPEQQGTLLTISNRARITIAGLIVAVGLLLSGGVAYATDHGNARRGQSCDLVGSYARDKSGDLYVCEKRKGDKCPVYHAAEPRPGDWGKPSPCVCPSKSTSASPSTSPSVSVSPSKSPSASTSPSVSAGPSKSASPEPSTTVAQPSTTPVAAQLPITGADNTVLWIALSGGFMVAGGGVLLVASIRRSRRTA